MAGTVGDPVDEAGGWGGGVSMGVSGYMWVEGVSEGLEVWGLRVGGLGRVD